MKNLQSLDRNMPILVVDDLSAMRRIVKNCLRKLGFENVTEAETAEQALEFLHSGDFDFVISNWNISNLKAEELLKRARETCADQTLPVLLVATQNHKNEALTLSDNKCTGVIMKPFTTDLLQERMCNILVK